MLSGVTYSGLEIKSRSLKKSSFFISPNYCCIQMTTVLLIDVATAEVCWKCVIYRRFK